MGLMGGCTVPEAAAAAAAAATAATAALVSGLCGTLGNVSLDRSSFVGCGMDVIWVIGAESTSAVASEGLMTSRRGASGARKWTLTSSAKMSPMTI